MTGTDNTAATEGAQIVGTLGRPARPADSERGEHNAESVLSLNPGAGPEPLRENGMASARPPARPARFDDPARNAAYWARVDRIAGQAPPLTDDQRARIRAAFHQPAPRAAA